MTIIHSWPVETIVQTTTSMEKSVDQLALYIRTVWLVQQAALSLVTAPFATGGDKLLWLCIAAAAVRPSLGAVFVVSALLNAQRLSRWPVQWDSEVWSLSIDTTLLLMCVCAWTRDGLRRAPLRAWRGLSRDDRNRAFGWFARVARFQLACFYFGAFFWKLNTSFLDPRTSCAPIFFYQLIAAYVPPAWLAASSPLAVAVGRAAPLNTLAIELLLPVLIWRGGRSARRLALLLAVLFHGLIAVTPPPNNASGFSLTVAKYLFLLLDQHAAYAAHDVLSPDFWMGSCAAVSRSALLAVGVAAAAQVGSHPGKTDWFVPGYALSAAVLVRAVALAHRPIATMPVWPDSTRFLSRPCLGRRWSACAAAMGSLAICYALLGPLTGLMDQQSTNMYANLRIHAGSNHLLLPTGLALSSRLLPGGIVRVTATTSPTILSLYPSEISDFISPRAREYLRALGHSARQFNSMKRRILGPGAAPPDHTRAAARHGAPLAVPYTLPAVELRRLLREARAANESFRITYQHLPGMRGDERWRQSADGPIVRYSEDPAAGASACTMLASLAGPYLPCPPDELVLLPPAPRLLHKLVLLQPYPILPPSEGWTEVHCFGP